MPQNRGSFTPALGILFTRKRGLLLLIFFSISKSRSSSAATRTSRFCAAIHSRALWTLPVTSCSCRVPHPSWTAPSGRVSLPPAGSRTTRAAMTSPCSSQKQTSQSEGFSTRAHVLCPSVTRAVHSANRTHRAGHVEFHTRVRVESPSSPNSSTQPGLCPSAGSATSTACVSGLGLTLIAEHVGSRALHGMDHPFAAV